MLFRTKRSLFSFSSWSITYKELFDHNYIILQYFFKLFSMRAKMFRNYFDKRI